MNITKDIINDLIPLYAANECSPATRALVEDYLRQHPDEAAELRQIMSTPVLLRPGSAANLDEMEALQRARCRVRRRAWLLGLAIFFSLCPFSVEKLPGQDHAHWMFLDSPGSALIYAGVAVILWIAYFTCRSRSQTL